MANNPYQAYANTQATTATPGELTLMLYNGAIRFMKQAISALDKQDVNQSHKNLVKSQDIILELMSTLNMDYPISNNLMSLYDFMHRQLVQSNVSKNAKLVQEVLELTEELRDTWVQVIKQSRTQPAIGIAR